ncbi:nucleoside triphosphate pyrophosphohydrolase [Sphingobium nicotianae]|uniref:Nucleoside triphosphate pyrophosphohydrolase n=1 Tax=Sphingobium nicotianae TaxID=2782607 RepID=A0A9X1AJZ8_9SPHN|nr:nucleoside triphosphate pyrophosphohydrolase [Sphingobium nicotianae]MBT2185588.1 nucleoside triphosphate pyrophosphohydrolase [Sphingobium nicotianae]
MDDRAADITPLQAIMARLRDPERGCPWDVEQTFATIAPYTIEEAYEVADAIERGDTAALKDELGDLLFQVMFHSRMAQEAGSFDLSDVITAICDKMVRRHPHVFGDGQASPGWEQIKAAERAEKADDDPSALAGVAVALPALLRSEKLQKRASRVGFDWDDIADVRAKLLEEIEEVDNAETPQEIEDEIGDVLYAAVNLARHHGVDPEAALRGANAKFERRFRAMEALAGDAFPDLPIDQKEALWQAVKRAEG